MEDYSIYNKKWLQDNYSPKVIAYYYRELNNFSMKERHIHNRVEIMYVVKGECQIEMENETITMKKRDLILLDTTTSHRLIIQNKNDCRMFNIEFVFINSNSIFPSIKNLYENISCFKSLIELKKKYLVVKDSDEVYTALKNLIMRLDLKKDENDFMEQLLITQILIKISEIVNDDLSYCNKAYNIHIKKSLDYIHNHYDKEIKVEDIAKQVNIHPNYLHRIFKESLNCTPIDYLNNLRIEKAKMLLLNTNIPVIDISDYIGINSRQYFTYKFKKETGFTPVKYRNKRDVLKAFDRKDI